MSNLYYLNDYRIKKEKEKAKTINQDLEKNADSKKEKLKEQRKERNKAATYNFKNRIKAQFRP